MRLPGMARLDRRLFVAVLGVCVLVAACGGGSVAPSASPPETGTPEPSGSADLPMPTRPATRVPLLTGAPVRPAAASLATRAAA